ncbi:MAG: hypothetical protein J0L92_39620 [Deltaproteobacteria bacterium]|nr:hypothetical protein [Deltaproteobacteria bacterium]
MSREARAGLATFLLFGLLGCASSSAPSAERPPPGAPPSSSAAASEPPVEAVAPQDPLPRPEPRVEVPAPADLRAALDADRPSVELVPRVCPVVTGATLSTNGETGCVMDPVRGLPRAIRRFALTRRRDVRVASDGDDAIIVVPSDEDGAVTPFDGGVWRWQIASDSFDAIVAPASLLHDQTFLPDVARTHFGVVISDHGSRERNWLVAGGAIRRLHPVEDFIGDTTIVDGHSYRVTADGPRRNVLELTYDGDGHVRFDHRGSVPSAEHLPLFVAFPEGRALIASVFPRGRAATLHVLELPSGTARVVDLAITRPTSMRVVEHALEIRSSTEGLRVDLVSGAITEAGPAVGRAAEPVAPLSATPSSLMRIGFFEADSLLLAAAGNHRWVREGGVTVLTYEEADVLPIVNEYDLAPPRGRCRCEGDALACPDAAPLANACAPARPASARVHSQQHPPPSRGFSIDGRFRWDVLEPDLLRLTRLADSERLWLRVIAGRVLVQADDGAFWLEPGAELEPTAVRWGPSLLEAPVTRLEDHVTALRRDTLLADFLGGRALPRAELPTLASLAADRVQ